MPGGGGEVHPVLVGAGVQGVVLGGGIDVDRLARALSHGVVGLAGVGGIGPYPECVRTGRGPDAAHLDVEHVRSRRSPGELRESVIPGVVIRGQQAQVRLVVQFQARVGNRAGAVGRLRDVLSAARRREPEPVLITDGADGADHHRAVHRRLVGRARRVVGLVLVSGTGRSTGHQRHHAERSADARCPRV